MRRRHFIALLVFAISAPGQQTSKPSITLMTNAAALLPANNTYHRITQGGIATIFGSNLATSTAQASGYPLPK